MLRAGRLGAALLRRVRYPPSRRRGPRRAVTSATRARTPRARAQPVRRRCARPVRRGRAPRPRRRRSDAGPRRRRPALAALAGDPEDGDAGADRAPAAQSTADSARPTRDPIPPPARATPTRPRRPSGTKAGHAAGRGTAPARAPSRPRPGPRHPLPAPRPAATPHGGRTTPGASVDPWIQNSKGKCPRPPRLRQLPERLPNERRWSREARPNTRATSPPAPADAGAPRRAPSCAAARRLTERFALMQSELGGAFYEMAIRDHVRLDVLIARPPSCSGSTPSCGARAGCSRPRRRRHGGHCPSLRCPSARGAAFCPQCASTAGRRDAPCPARTIRATRGQLVTVVVILDTRPHGGDHRRDRRSLWEPRRRGPAWSRSRTASEVLVQRRRWARAARECSAT